MRLNTLIPIFCFIYLISSLVALPLLTSVFFKQVKRNQYRLVRYLQYLLIWIGCLGLLILLFFLIAIGFLLSLQILGVMT